MAVLLAGAASAFAQLNDGDMSRYVAADAVPMVDGRVVFTDNIKLDGGHTPAQVGDVAKKWMTDYLSKFDKQTNRIISGKPGEIVAMGEREIIFTDNAISLDKARMSYVLNLKWSASDCILKIERVKYVYGTAPDIEKFTAEEYITDEFAVNRKRTKLTPITGKFRKATLDFVDEVFGSFKEAFKYYTAAGLAEIVKNAPQVMQAVQPQQPAKPSGSAQPVKDTVPVAPAVQKAVAADKVASAVKVAGMEGFRKISPEELEGNFIKKISKEWMLVTAGNREKFNMMTASWGGIGVLYNKPVAICFINPARYTYQIMESGDTYTLTFYPEQYRDALQYCGTKSGRDEDKVKGSGLVPVEVETGAMAFEQANIIIECRKLVSQSISLDAISNPEERNKRATSAMHKMYIGEILNVWVK